MPIIDIPEVGEVEFPEGMSDAEISSAAEQLYGEAAQARVSPNPTVNRRIDPSMRLDRNAGLREQQRQAAATGDRAEAVADALGWADFLIRPFAATAENPLGAAGSAARGAGQVLNEAGAVAGAVVRDVRLGNTMLPNTAAALSGTDIGPSPGGAVGGGLDAAGQALPLVAGGMALQAAGVPAAAAFGGPMAVSALDASGGDINAALKAGATGALIPGVAQLGREAAANALGRAVAAGVRTGGNVPEKIAEALAAQGVVQVFMEGLNLPDYVRMDPEQRREALLQNLVANTAFLAMDVPGVVSRSGSLTSQTKGGKTAQVGAIMEHLVNEPAAMDRLRAAVDEVASQALSPRRAGVEFTPPEIANVEPQFVDPALEPFRGQELKVEPQVLSAPETIQETLPKEVTDNGQKEEWRQTLLERPAPTIEAPTAPVAEAPATAPEPGQQKRAKGTKPEARAEVDSSKSAIAAAKGRSRSGKSSGPAAKSSAPDVPARAVEKVQEHVAEVAAGEKQATPEPALEHTTGPRAAKEIKSELVQRIEAELAKMPEFPEPSYSKPATYNGKKEFTAVIEGHAVKVREGFGNVWEIVTTVSKPDKKSPTGEKRTEVVLAKTVAYADMTAAKRLATQELEKMAFPKRAKQTIRIQIPGDGDFTINGTRTALERMLARAKALETSSTKAKNYTESLPSKQQGEMWAAESAESPEQSFYVRAGKEFKKVGGKVVKLDAVPEHEFFLHRSIEPGTSGYVVSETTTGLRVGYGANAKEAMKAAEAAVAKMGVERTRQAIAKELKQGNATPRAQAKRSSSMGDPVMSAPVPPNAPATPPPGSPGVALLFDQRLPVTLDRSAPGAVSVPQVMQALEGVIQAAGGQTPIRVGRFNKSRARGIYNPRTEVARINAADNIPTATHEIGHASQKLLYGTAYAAGLKGLPPAIKRELVALGRALYGNTRPAAGYSSEGWAEFIRHYITTDDAARLAPETEKYFREKVLVDHPEFGRAVTEARKMVDVYRAQGSIGRAQQQLVKGPGTLARIAKTIRETVGIAAQVDEFEPLWQLAKGYEERSGNQLAPSEDPFLLASWKRGTAGAVVETMVNDAMIDPWGNPYAGPGNLSLKQALAPIKGRGEDFALYLFGRRAVERWRKGKNPGLSRADAEYLVQHFDSPEFQLAASHYYEWNRGLLEYVREADPAMSGTIDAILASSSDYAPLARIIDPKGASALAAAARSNPLQRMRGSGRQVKDIFEATIENAARLVTHAHRKMVLDAIVKLSRKEGMGFLVEEVPRSKVRTEVNFEKLRDQLEQMGVDTSMVDEGEILAYFDLADKPKGADPIITVRESDGLHWYHVSPAVFDLLNGLNPARLHPALDLLLGAPARAFRLGTTGLRPSFSLFTNPTRDFRTLLVQTQSHANPAELGAAYFSALGEVVRNGLGGQASDHVQAFYRLGAQLGQPLGVDIRHTKRAAKELFRGRLGRVVTNPVDHLRDLLQITESAPRVAELKLIAKEVGWEPGRPMTPDQAVQIALAAKRVTVDFSAAGRISRTINQAVPFYNAVIQGTRSFARALRDNPTRAVLTGLATITVPALLNWWRNKDKEWYRGLPWRERYLYDNIEDGSNVWQIPRPQEWGNLFAVLPEAILDSWYVQDPRGAEEALKHIIATTNPLDFPVPLKIAKEQWQNRIDFFDRPIVPRNQIDLPPGDQRGPYTTRLGEMLGNAFPGTISPRRVDAGVRSYFGGALPDLMDAVGLGSVKRDREWERSDLPVLGRMFRRGGEFTANHLAIGDYYDDLTRYSSRGQAMAKAMADGRQPLNPLSPQEYAYWQALETLRPTFKAAAQVADHTSSLSARQSLYRDMARLAAQVRENRPK